MAPAVTWFTLFTLWFIGLFGWCYNVFWIMVRATETDVTFFVSLVGIIVMPLGVVTGWVHFI